MPKQQTKLTSVNIIDDVYKRFKIKTIDGSINLQKLVNRSLDLYNTREDFRKQIDNHNGLAPNGSKF
jgi:hypothetical protein